MSDRTRHRGFALLLTLVLVLLAGVALAVVVRRGMVEALETWDAADQLQRRWAVASCRDTLLPRAGTLLDLANARALADGGRPVAELRVDIELAGAGYELVFTDEQAKYNPNLMLALTDERTVRSAVRSLAEARRSADDAPDVVLRRLVGSDAPAPGVGGEQDEQPAAMRSFGQLFDAAAPAWLRDGEPAPASRLTCWGDGYLNVHRAEDAVLRRALGPLVEPGSVEALLASRREEPGQTLKELVNGLPGVNPTDRAVFEVVLTGHSTGHGLWVIAHGQTRSWYTFSARVQSADETRPAAAGGTREPTTTDRIQGATSYEYVPVEAGPATDTPQAGDEQPADEPDGRSGATRFDFEW